MTVSSGSSTTVHVALNQTGAQLLATRHKLAVRLVLTASGQSSAVSSQTITFEAKKPKRHRS
ncbi:MAG: hypothetical protein ACLP50_22265 [Solirubrobacteraceae bacterium]